MTTTQAQAVPRQLARRRDALGARYDAWLTGAAVALLSLGLVMVASASVPKAERELGEALYYFWRQAAYVATGVLVAA